MAGGAPVRWRCRGPGRGTAGDSAIRLTGLYLALSTFGFGILLQGMFYTQDYMFGGTGAALTMPRPHWSWLPVSDDRGYYWLVLFLAAVVVCLVTALTRSRLGRLLRGLADSPTAVATSGAEVNLTRVLVFCLSAFLASVGGALLAVAQTSVSGSAYQPLTSLVWFALIVVLGGGPVGAVLAAAATYLIPAYIDSDQVSNVLQLAFGAAALIVAMAPHAVFSLPRPVQDMLNRFAPSGRRSSRQGSVEPRGSVASGSLEVRGLEVRFGGLRAVKSVDLEAPVGRITGLIGPNGAGKTTTFNVCSGLQSPSSGTVIFGGHDISSKGPAARARAGIGRTFQRMELLESLTVKQNVALGSEGARAGLNPVSHLVSSPASGRRVSAHAEDAMEMCGISDLASRPVAALSTGQRRLVELARCLAGDFRVLLLDEPSSGLDHDETRRFGEILQEVVADRGVGILIVEHDMPLVLDVCEYIYVLDFGELIFEGSPREVAASPLVRSAYLGEADLVEADVPDEVTA